MNEIEELKRRIDLLEFKLNEFRKPDSYSFPRALITLVGTKFGLFGATPITQPLSTGETTGASAASVTNTTTFTGNNGSTAYTILDVVKHLKNLGLLKK